MTDIATAPAVSFVEHDGALLRVRLARPKANIVDAAMIAALEEGKALMKRGKVDLSRLDERIEELCAKLLLTFPDCTTKTVEELRKPKLEAWNRNKENHRAWLALNMVTEARAGFTAFNEGSKDDREVDFIALRQALARTESWVGPLHDSIQPKARKRA